MSELGASLVHEGANILHHCNTGALATVDIGTALGVIYGAQALNQSVYTSPSRSFCRMPRFEQEYSCMG